MVARTCSALLITFLAIFFSPSRVHALEYPLSDASLDRLFLSGEAQIFDFLQYANAACDGGRPHPQFAVSWSGACDGGRPHGAGHLWVSLRKAWNLKITAQIVGTFVQGRLEGPATVGFDSGTHSSFVGQFHDSEPDGHGVLIERDGTRFEGEYIYGSLEGAATIDFPDGAHAEFTVRSGKLTGASSFRFPDGTVMESDGGSGPNFSMPLHGGGRLLVEGHGPYSWGLLCSRVGRRVTGEFFPPMTQDSVNLPYPSLSRRLNEQGTVWVSLVVEEDGSTSHVALHQSSGYERLDNAAVTTVARWHYSAAIFRDRPIAMPLIVSLIYDFRPPPDMTNIEYFGSDTPDPPPGWRLHDCRR